MGHRFKVILKEWIIPFGIEIIVVLLLVKFVFFFVVVPTGSMIPTIEEGSYLFALRVHNPEKLQRGDIVVFESDEVGKTLVKRLVGLPGETLVIDDAGIVYIDGKQLDEPYVKNQSAQSGQFVVPPDCFFFVGDNRSGSFDARSWGNPYIPADAIEGRAVFTLYPFNKFGVLQ